MIRCLRQPSRTVPFTPNEVRWKIALALGLLFLLRAPAGIAEPGAPDSFSIDSPPDSPFTAPDFAIDAQLPFDPETEFGQFENGLTYYIRENREPRSRAELRLVLNAGSVLEEDEQQGLAHFLEHMAFNGTENYSEHEIIDYLESIGMDFGPEINAYTSFDETVYMLKVPTDEPEILRKAFEILAEWSRRILLEAEEIEKEKGVVIEEWRLGRGAEQRMRDVQFPVLFQGSRYAERLPIGKPETVQEASRERLLEFYESWYRPDLMAIVAVGDFEREQIAELVRENFADFAGLPTQSKPRPEFEVPEHEQTLISIATDEEATTSRVRIAVKVPKQVQRTVADYRQAILESLYDGMFNQRLNELLQQEDPPFINAYAGSGELARTKDSITLGAFVENGGIVRGLRTILLEAKRVRDFGFTTGELERQRKRVMRAIRKSYQERDRTNSASFAGVYAAHFLDDIAVPGIEYRYELYQRLLPEIALEEVNALERDWLSQENRVILVNAPKKDDVPVPRKEELLAVFDEIEETLVEPYVDEIDGESLLDELPSPGRIVAEELTPSLDLTEWTLSNGVRVLFKPTDFREDEVIFRAWSPGGRSLGSPDDDLSLDFAAMLTSAGGVGDYDIVQLRKLLAGKRVDASPNISELSEGLSGGASPEDLETMFQLVHLYVTRPRPDPTAFASLKSRYSALLANRASDPQAAFGDTLGVTLTSYHPSTRPLTSERLQKIDLDRAIEFYRERFADASDFTFIIVGNTDAGTLKPLLKTYLGSLPGLQREESWYDRGVRYPEGIIEKVVRRGVDEKARTTIVFHGPFDWNRENRFFLNSLASILDIRLREVIREDLSGTYGVSVSASPERDPLQEYTLSISFGADPQRLEMLTDEVFGVLRTLQSDGIGEDYVQKVREKRLREHEEGLRQNGYWLSSILFRDRYGIDQLEMNETEELIRTLSSSEVQEAARRYLDFQRYVRVSLMPADEGR